MLLLFAITKMHIVCAVILLCAICFVWAIITAKKEPEEEPEKDVTDILQDVHYLWRGNKSSHLN